MIKLGRKWPQVVKADSKWMLDQYGDAPGQLRKPLDVCVMHDGHIAVTDVYNYRVQLLDANGRGSARLAPTSRVILNRAVSPATFTIKSSPQM